MLFICSVPTCRELIQLLDDDIVSLTALTLIIDSKCRHLSYNSSITQLTLTVAVSDDSVSVKATSLTDVTGSDTRLC